MSPVFVGHGGDTGGRNAPLNGGKRRKVNRSALFREALREYLRRAHIAELEERDRRGYEARPETEEERAFGKGETAWLED